MLPNLSFRASLKNLEVEEVIDLVVHRPLGYLVARAAYPTSVTPDAITLFSMLAGLASGAMFYAEPVTGRSHEVLAGSLLILSAVLDCADGQLARMRGSSSRFGRMLDGAVDAVVQVAAIPAALIAMIWRLGGITEQALVWGALGVFAILSGIRHTTIYDQFKNVYARNTEPAPRDCDDLEEVDAERARLERTGSMSWLDRTRFAMYHVHLSLVRQTMHWIDPCIPARFADMPGYSPERAARFRALEGGLMRAWTFFGVGTHIFVFAVCAMISHVEWYIVLRLVGFNAALLVLVPLQRRASREFFGTGSPDGHTSTVTA